MTNRVLAGIALLVMMCLAGAAGAQGPQVQTADYEKWSFKIGLPSDADKIEFQPEGDTLLSEVYVKDNLAYHIKIINVVSDLLTPTEIEKMIQAAVNAGKGAGETVRWELETKEKRLFKGYNHDVVFDADTLARMPYLKNLLPDGKGVETVALAQVTDDTSPILSIAVVGPREKAMDVSTRAKFTAYTVATLQKKEGKKETGPKPDVKPDTSAAKPPKQTKPARVRPQLKKGEIELVGVVESVGKDGKNLVLVVDSIKLLDQDAITLDPPRPKTVVMDRIPGDVRVGARLLVIGKNEGAGKPIRPSFIEPVKEGEQSKQPALIRVP